MPAGRLSLAHGASRGKSSHTNPGEVGPKADEPCSLFGLQFLTLTGIPAGAYEYRLGKRSALEWVIDQYQVSTDRRSGITNDPNREDDE